LVIDVIAFAMTILGLVLMVFGLGAVSGWAWAMKSLDPRPPYWLAGVLAAAGLSFVASSALHADWLMALSWTLMFALIVIGNLRIGPFRPKSADHQSS
jgi:predicted MFS family arabinose efflux permease